MKIDGIIWLRDVAEKLEFKHNVTMEEVEEALNNKPTFRFVEKGERKGEDVQRTKEALILSARDMADKERKQYGKK